MKNLKIVITVIGLFFAFIVNAAEPVYVNTNGDAISDADIGEYCRPTEKLSDGKIMVFTKSTSDLAFYDARLEANGVTDARERAKMVTDASSDDCDRKAGNKCGEGKCTSGTCKTKYSGGMTSCSCQ